MRQWKISHSIVSKRMDHASYNIQGVEQALYIEIVAERRK